MGFLVRTLLALARFLTEARRTARFRVWQAGPVTDAQIPEPDRTLENLVGDWLTVPDLAEALDLPLKQVRQLISERQLLSHRVGERLVIAVPTRFVRDGAILPNLVGTIVVLGDAGLKDDAIMTWLFTPDETLPIEGAPIDMLWAGRRAEVRKRAQELAF